MANIDLKDVLALYHTPSKNEDPAIDSRSTLNRVISAAGSAFPRVRTVGYLTDIALPEKDGDVHFYVETEEGARRADVAMMACEIQGIYKSGRRGSEDRRMTAFRQLFGKKVVLEALLRAWPEHLRDSRQPHLFQFHPVLTIGEPDRLPIDFTDRVVWPTGEDPREAARSFGAVVDAPHGLRISSTDDRIVFRTPSKSMKRENYVHVEGYFRGGTQRQRTGASFALFAGPQGDASIPCFVLESTPPYDKVGQMANGRYEVGGLCSLDLPSLTAEPPAWNVRLSPVLSLKRLGA